MSGAALFLVSRLVRQGPINQLVGLLRHLPAVGVRCEVVTFDEPHDSAVLDEVAALGVRVTALRGASLHERGLNLALIAKDYSVGAVVSAGVRADYLNARYGPRGRRIAVKHEVAFSPYGRSRLISAAMRSAHLLLLARMDHIICVSNNVRESLPAALRVMASSIPNGVDTSYYHAPTALERGSARAKLGVQDGTMSMLFLGSLDRNKRPHLVIEPLRLLLARGLQVRLFVAGDGPLRDVLDRGVSEGLPVSLLGFRDDVRELLWASDVLVLPSAHEGLPMAVIESMACGVPVVLSDIGSHREILDGASEAGVLCNPLVPSAFASALELVLRSRGAMAPRGVAERRYSAASMAAAYANLLQRFVIAD